MPENEIYDKKTLEMVIDLLIEIQNSSVNLIKEESLKKDLMSKLIKENGASLEQSETVMDLIESTFPLCMNLACFMIIKQLEALKNALNGQ